MKKSRIRISQCMIVKNEEKNIEKALSWGKGIVSEQIVVDTGSTDRTVEIAERMGAKICHFTWIDDFAAAKNFAIEQAQYEWIALLDADEYLSLEDAQKLLPCIEEIHETENDGIAMGWLHLDANGNVTELDTQIRVFRNRSGLRYHRRVHEYLALNGVPIRAADRIENFSIFHTGYVEATLKKKTASGRNTRLILEELKEHPKAYDMWGYLGNEYCAEERYKEAEEAYLKGISLMPEQLLDGRDLMGPYIYQKLLVLRAFLTKQDEESVLEVYKQAIERAPMEGDFDYHMGEYYAAAGRYREAEQHLRRGLALLEQYGNMGKSTVLSGHLVKVYELMAICCYNNNNLAECVRYTTMLLKGDAYLMSTLVLLISAFAKDEGTLRLGEAGAAQVAEFLGTKFYNFQSLKDRIFVLRAAMAAGYPKLAEVLRRTLTPEELAAFEKAVGKGSAAAPKPEAVLDRTIRIVLFYSQVESFNFFTDQLAEEFAKKGHEVFIFDLRMPSEEDPHSQKHFEQFISEKVDAAVCFDALGVREDLYPGINAVWNRHQTVVMDFFMDAPPRFYPAFLEPPENYHLFCCDRDHVDYVRRYYGETVKNISFLPHVGVLPEESAKVIPYKERTFDILFCGTYYRPADKFADLRRELEETFPGDTALYQFYEQMYQNLTADSSLNIEQAALRTAEQIKWEIPHDFMEVVMYCAESVDWAIRMYQRERVVEVLAASGQELYLLGRGWENHPSAGLPNVHRIDDRIPYKDTLAYMGNARINLNVMPWFKAGTHDRIFNALLQKSVPLTDASSWITEHFTDGTDIALYDLKHLEMLPQITQRLLKDSELAEHIIQKGYEKVSRTFTWQNCAGWLLSTAAEYGEKR